MITRLLKNTSQDITATFYAGGVATDADGPVTVNITDSAGASVVAAGVGTPTGTTGEYRIGLTPSVGTDQLETLTAAWSGTISGDPQTITTTIEIVGEFLFTIAEARALAPLGNVSDYPTDVLVAMRTTVEDEIEQACGCAFVPRYALETTNGTGGRSILLRPHVLGVRSAVVGGAAFGVADLAALSAGITGVVSSSSRTWTAGTSNVVVGYEHGFRSVPAGIKRAALILAKTWLVGRNSPLDDRATTYGAENGISYSLAVAGRNGSHFGIPDVDSAIDRYSLVALVA